MNSKEIFAGENEFRKLLSMFDDPDGYLIDRDFIMNPNDSKYIPSNPGTPSKRKNVRRSNKTKKRKRG